MTGVLIRREDTEIDTHRKEGHVKTDAETGCDAAISRRTPEATRSWKRQGKIFP